jgi:hypothetical protein
MGCESSKKSIDLVVNLDSRYFQDSEISCKKPLDCKVQDLFSEARKKLLKPDESVDLKLCVGGTYVDSTSVMSLNDLGICESSSLKMQVRSNTIKITVSVQTDPPSKSVISFQKKKSIEELKKKVIKNTTPDSVIALLRNIVLTDDVLIKDLNLKEQEVITFVLKNESGLLALWRYKYPGLVIEGLCMNCDCQAYKQRVSISKGYGTFDITSELCGTHECPSCMVSISRVVCVGVAWCAYTIEYFNSNEEKLIHKESIEHYFEIPKDWKKPVIEIRKLHID